MHFSTLLLLLLLQNLYSAQIQANSSQRRWHIMCIVRKSTCQHRVNSRTWRVGIFLWVPGLGLSATPMLDTLASWLLLTWECWSDIQQAFSIHYCSCNSRDKGHTHRPKLLTLNWWALMGVYPACLWQLAYITKHNSHVNCSHSALAYSHGIH